MQTFWSRNGEGASVDKVRGNPGEDACNGPARRYRRLLRPALAASSAAMLIVAFGVFGGPGYAASAKHSVANVINVFQAPTRANDLAKNAGATSQNAATNNSEASKHDQRGGDNHGGGGGHDGDDDDQYRPGKGCGDDHHVHSRHNECHDHGGHGGHHRH